MLNREINALCSEIHTTHVNTLCGQNVEFVNVKLAGGPGSSVGTAIGYGLDGPGIEFRWGRDFPHLFRPALWPIQPPVQLIPRLFLG
jgi:hypothetical protein